MNEKIKHVLNNPKIILTWILYHGFGRLFPDDIYLRMVYRLVMGEKLNLDNPKTYTEKLQWLKIHDRKDIYTTMVDKYEAKNYVVGIIGDEHIIPTLGVWDRFEDIDFAVLPEQFVLKCTHDSGGLVICKNKAEFDVNTARKKINRSLKRNYFWQNREWPYKNVKPRIIAEKYMEDRLTKELIDYKFFCFNGSPEMLYISRGLENHSTAQISFYDMHGEELPFHRNDYAPFHNAVFPDNFDEMKDLAIVLAQKVDCPFVRIDLYSISGKIYFSEITFSPNAGFVPFDTKRANEELGKMLHLPFEK